MRFRLRIKGLIVAAAAAAVIILAAAARQWTDARAVLGACKSAALEAHWPYLAAAGCALVTGAAAASLAFGVRLRLARRAMSKEVKRIRQIERAKVEQYAQAKVRQAVLVELAKSKEVADGDFDSAVRIITRRTCEVLGASRVSVWRLSDDRRRLLCAGVHERKASRRYLDAVLRAEDYPRYFEAIEKGLVVDGAHYGRADPRIRALSEGSLTQSSAVAVVDGVVKVGGRIAGILCCERSTASGLWANEEIAFAAQIAGIVAMSLGNLHEKSSHRRQQLRIKHLNCYYGLSRLLERPNISLERIFREAVELIKSAYHCSDLTCVRITFDGIQYKTENFRKTEASQCAGFSVSQRQIGSIEVYYLGMRNAQDEGPFLKEEHDMLSAFAERLGNIAQLKQITENLRLFRDLVERSNDCIFVVDAARGRFLDVNQTACESLGYTVRELLDMSFGHIDPSVAGEEQWRQRVAQLKDGEADVVSECTFRRKDSSTFVAEVGLKLVSMAKQDCIIAIARDVTERRKAQQVKERLLGEVQQANQDLTDFAHIVSHDLKAPLRGLSTLANWIAEDYRDKLDEEGREKIALMLQQVDRMHKLIEGVLQYSRAGRAKEQHSRVDLNELVRGVIDAVSAPENIEISIADRLPEIECEPTRVMQVFQNLLSNAVKYSDKPKGRILVGCADDGGFWRFSVSDNGPGIAAEHRERIFKMFQTVGANDGYESTGVGLAVAKKVVELYNGRIWVESEPGEGSKFIFTLPKRPDVAESPVYTVAVSGGAPHA